MKRLTSIFIGFLAFAFGGCKETPPAPPTVGPTQLATPAVTLGAITPTTAAFSWKKVENADGYEYTIKREETTVVSQKVPDDETEAVAEGLESETSYTLALRALATTNTKTPPGVKSLSRPGPMNRNRPAMSQFRTKSSKNIFSTTAST